MYTKSLQETMMQYNENSASNQLTRMHDDALMNHDVMYSVLNV